MMFASSNLNVVINATYNMLRTERRDG